MQTAQQPSAEQPRTNILPMHRVRAGAPPPCAFPDEPFTCSDASRSAAGFTREEHATARAAATASTVPPRRVRGAWAPALLLVLSLVAAVAALGGLVLLVRSL